MIKFISIHQYIKFLKYQNKLNLSQICIENKIIQLNNNFFEKLGLCEFKDIKTYESHIKSKVCAGCYKIFKNQKDIFSFKCGCHYCLSCQKAIYDKKTKTICYKCSN